ncbi:MAG: hypothetical protein ACRC2T_14955 [Thermoguttaceae bacterium]
MDKNIRLFSFFVLVAIVTFTGCDKSPYKVVPIEGTATWKGNPIPEGFSLEFTPEEGRASSGFISKEGKFKTVYSAQKDGVQTGKNKVKVMWNTGTMPPPPEEYIELVNTYGYKSEGIEIEIKKADKNLTIDFK